MIQENISLKTYNTFGVASFSRYFMNINNQEDIARLVDWKNKYDLPCLIVGGGSNLLFKNDFPGLVAYIALKGKEKISEDEHANYIKVGAGEVWHDVVLWSIDQGYAGLENLSLIPGSVGAAPVQNIGAYGVELVDRLFSLEAVDLETGKIRGFSNEQCQFAYRDSLFKSAVPDRYLIISVTFRLPKQPEWTLSYAGVNDRLKGQQPSARLISDIIVALRRSKLPDPSGIGNAGSFFKNPVMNESVWNSLKTEFPQLPGYPQKNKKVKTSAAWLIDQCGWKGKREGDVGTYHKHALVLVNHGGATGQQLWDFAENIIISVNQKFSVVLEPEPRII